jgi:hypothetical protein
VGLYATVKIYGSIYKPALHFEHIYLAAVNFFNQCLEHEGRIYDWLEGLDFRVNENELPLHSLPKSSEPYSDKIFSDPLCYHRMTE